VQGQKVVTDSNNTVMAEAVNFFKKLTSKNSVSIEFHFNIGPPEATGVETLVKDDADIENCIFANKISKKISEILTIRTRGNYKGFPGVKKESDSQHSKIGWFRLSGVTLLVEVCFLSNPKDMELFFKHETQLYKELSYLLYEMLNETLPTDNIHRVVAGETLFSIANKYNTTTAKIRLKNQLSNDLIFPGQTLSV
jgi:hypothetical protein